MKLCLLPEEGNFYKANLHCHTNLSDGKMTREEIKAHYMSLGYQVVCYTDHEVLLGHKDLCDENFVALHGYEVAIKKDLSAHTAYFMPVYHFNLIAEEQDNLTMPRFFIGNNSYPGSSKKWLDEVGKFDENDTMETVKYDVDFINDYVKAVSEKGFLVTYNHPMWSLHNYADFIGLRGLHAIEVINGGCTVLNDNTSVHFEQLLRAGVDILPIGGDDNHNKSTCGIGWTMIKAKALTYEALIEAYKKGDCYASEGPEILSLTLEDDPEGKESYICVKTSAASAISLLSEGRACAVKRSEDGTATEAEFSYAPKAFGRYFRIEVRDKEGRKAFSRAYTIDEIEKKRK